MEASLLSLTCLIELVVANKMYSAGFLRRLADALLVKVVTSNLSK